MAGSLERLENAKCVSAYAQPFQAARADVVLIVDPAGTNKNASFETLERSPWPDFGSDTVPNPYP